MNLLVVDGSNVVMRCAYGGEIVPDVAVATATAMIERAARSLGATHLVIALDCPGAPSWRKALYPQYKGNRKVDTSPWLLAAAERWQRLGWWVEAVVGFEADDVIATVAARAAGRGRVMVFSSDSDVLPLVADERVTVIKPASGGHWQFIKAEEVRAKYGIAMPGQLVDLKAMTGEAGDNVPGVEGIGPVRAKQLLSVYGDLEGVIAAGRSNGCKYAQKVFAAEAVARLARQLVTLHAEVPIVPISPKACAFGPWAGHARVEEERMELCPAE